MISPIDAWIEAWNNSDKHIPFNEFLDRCETLYLCFLEAELAKLKENNV